MILRALLALALLAAIGAAVIWQVVQQRWQEPLNIPEAGYTLTVEPGDSLRAVAARLQASGVLRYPRLLQAYGRWSGLDAQIKRGEYRLPAAITMQELLELLRQGRVIQYQVTLPEGITLHQAIKLLQGHEVLRAELSGADDPRLLQLVQPHEHPEGMFFPSSYRFERGASDWQLLQRAHAAMREILDEEWSQRADGLPYETPYEALIMASLIEKETGLAEERAQIAGVFVRRLRKGMRLQTDPTIIYGLGESFDGNLTRAHLRDDGNLYNSYRHHGLPPTPIALPGREAIHAALHPAQGDTLYFVARGDGGHVFSATLEAHQRAVRKYQLRRRDDYRSSPGKAE